MAHRQHHPEPVEGCFGCKVAGIGWQGIQSAAGGRRSDPLRRHPVTADDGARRGQVVGHHVEHWSGQRDAVVRAPTAVLKASQEERA